MKKENTIELPKPCKNNSTHILLAILETKVGVWLATRICSHIGDPRWTPSQLHFQLLVRNTSRQQIKHAKWKMTHPPGSEGQVTEIGRQGPDKQCHNEEAPAESNRCTAHPVTHSKKKINRKGRTCKEYVIQSFGVCLCVYVCRIVYCFFEFFSLCAFRILPVPMSVRCQNVWIWSRRQLWAAMWVLGIQPGSSGRAVVLLTTKSSLQFFELLLVCLRQGFSV